MKKQLYTIAALLLMGIAADAQVGIGTTTPNNSAMLDITSTSAGLLKPRMATGQRTAIASPATGLEVYDTTTNTTWFFNGTVWVDTAPITADVRLVGTRNHITSDAGPGTNGTTMGGGDNIALGSNTMIANVSGTRNVAMNTFALQNNTTGSQNIAIGQEALNLNTTASNNIALGFQALKNNTASNFNIAVGTDAMSLATGDATHGIENIAVGIGALKNNTGNPSIASSASNNVAVGNGALLANTTGDHNTAIGQDVLGTNLAGIQNTGIGFLSLYNNKGSFNTGLGVAAGSSMGTASYNTAVGYGSMSSANTVTGNFNTAIGVQALEKLSSGTTNVAVGHVALASNTIGSNNVAVGDQSLTNVTTGNLNTAIGNYSAPSITTGSNNIAIGNGTNLTNSTTGSDQMNIGNTIFGTSLPNAASGYQPVANSYVGILASNPTAALDVNGTTRVRNLPGGSTTDKVVTADANGNLRALSSPLFNEVAKGAVKLPISSAAFTNHSTSIYDTADFYCTRAVFTGSTAQTPPQMICDYEYRGAPLSIPASSYTFVNAFNNQGAPDIFVGNTFSVSNVTSTITGDTRTKITIKWVRADHLINAWGLTFDGSVLIVR